MLHNANHTTSSSKAIIREPEILSAKVSQLEPRSEGGRPEHMDALHGFGAVSPVAMHTEERLESKDPLMEDTLERLRRFAPSQATVLVSGETGVGKELFARAIHLGSSRASGPFVRIHCAALPETVLEAALFGYETGAFSRMPEGQKGGFEAAHGGTLFLDEISELSSSVQAKLLSVLESGSIRRLGSLVDHSVDVRIIVATNKDLLSAVREERFREDLYYRLSGLSLHIPPLRERRADLTELATHFVTRFATGLGWEVPTITPEAWTQIYTYDWPGNIRELRNAMEHAVVLAMDGLIRIGQLPHTLAPVTQDFGLRAEVEAFERRRIEAALEQERGNQARAAARLGLPLRTLVYKLTRYRKRDQALSGESETVEAARREQRRPSRHGARHRRPRPPSSSRSNH